MTSPDPIAANCEALEPAARGVLSEAAYNYYAGGAEDETTLRANRAAFGRFYLRPRVLVDVGQVDTTTELLGERLSMPILLAPTAFQRLAHPEGEQASARAARAAGTLMVASTLSTTSVEDTAAAAPGPLWFQLYVFRQREITRALVERAEAAGCTAICLTVTVPVQGNRERDTRTGFRLPPELEMANFTGLRQAVFPDAGGSGLEAFIGREFDPTLTWGAVAWLRSITRLPIVLKGIMTPEDAALAVEHGADAVIVSNHGGRQLDGAEPTLLALPRVAEAVSGRIPVLMDGGVRRGTDVVKALALGARAVLVGRPALWGLAVDGQRGVERVLEMLHGELRRTLALLGRPSVGALDANAITEIPGFLLPPR
ncbi:MAG TPA: alpha-hydroxy acid oxidase [Longimicrobiaceae bacterium]